MIRIVGGSVGGRKLKVPPNGTRPTSERAREGLFSSLQSLMDLDSARVLDLYAGSGAVGLEALSRGAAEATFVESDRAAAQLIAANAAALAFARATVYNCPAAAFATGQQLSDQGERGAQRVGDERSREEQSGYDLIFADPPYAVSNEDLSELFGSLLGHGAIRSDAVMVVERPSRAEAFRWPQGVIALKHRRYGEGVLWYGQQQ